MFECGNILDDTYQLLQEIGVGGTGVIYLAYHLRLKKYVIIKKIKDGIANKVDARIEVDLLKKLHHSGLPQVYDFIELDDGIIYTVIDYIEGYDLAYYIKNGYQFTEEQLIHYLQQLLDVLIYLHNQTPSIIHSDIKPANIMLDTNGNAYLIDFNISFDSISAKVNGISPDYASYEQLQIVECLLQHRDISGAMIDGRTDIYSLAATFYELMTGITPYVGIAEEYPISNYVLPYGDAFLNIIQKAMCWDMNQRYQTAKDMKKAVDNLYKSTWKYRFKQIGMTATIVMVAGVIGATGIGIASRLKKQRLEAFDAGYQGIVMRANEGYSVGIDARTMLNQSEYSGILEASPDKKAELLYLCAMDYFYQEQYAQCLPYFQEAIEHNATDIYYRDYAICLARMGNMDKAMEIVNQATVLGLNSYNLDEVNAEICIQNRNYAEARSILNKIINECKEDELRFRSMELLITISDYSGNYQEFIDALQYADISYEYRDRYNKLMLYACTKQAEIMNREERINCYSQVVYYYEQISQKSILTMEDQISVAVAYQYVGQLGKGEELLNELMQEYGDSYVIYMQLAFYYYNEESRRSANTRDYSQVVYYYELATEKYNQSGITDDRMIQLSETVEDLNNKGWLK